MSNTNKVIMTTALGLAAIAVVIDHTRHKVPKPIPVSTESISTDSSEALEPATEEIESPCSLGNPCALNISPCALD